MYSKIMIWANATKFGQNFIAPPKFFGLVRLWPYLQASETSVGQTHGQNDHRSLSKTEVSFLLPVTANRAGYTV